MIGKLKIKVSLLIVLLAGSALAATDEENVGKAAAAQILGAAPLLDAQPVQRYLNQVGNSVAAASGTAYHWHFGAIKSDAVNAFAAPAGFILISSGLLKLVENEDELAFILAHEVAHVSRKHHYTVVQKQRLVAQASQSLQAMDKDGGVGMLSGLSGQMYARGLDKSAEYEADRIGVEIMTRAGYDPAAALSVLEKLMALQGNDPRAELLFSTHPSPASRLDLLASSGIEKLPRPKAKAAAVDKRFRSFRSQL
jgi:predicted Zn-dependent protease